MVWLIIFIGECGFHIGVRMIGFHGDILCFLWGLCVRGVVAWEQLLEELIVFG